TSFGSFRMPKMVGGVQFEHGHRMVAGAVTILTIILALWIWRIESRRWVRRLAALSVLTIVIQAVLGGITVLFYLPVVISVSHACMAQIFFCLAVSLALFTAKDWRWNEAKRQDSSSPSLRRLGVWTTALIFLQLMVGAAFRHNGLGIVPHMVGAVLVTAGVVWIAIRVFSRYADVPQLTRPALLLLVMLAAQVGLGIASYILKLRAILAPQPLPPVVDVTTIHVAVGALVFVTALAFTLQAFRFSAGKSTAPAMHAETVRVVEDGRMAPSSALRAR
ncbi:MAG TPA: COX15/CtaA family protein, partial [Terriglobia bacterium]|nr:COX15/CtaA family protein [Terriglobia bacterium]